MSNYNAKLDSFCYWAEQSLEKLAAAKKKSKKKLDPKAKVRNRGDVCVPAEKAKDGRDHYPLNNKNQALNALSRVHQYDKVPSWYKGSLKSLQDLVSKKVHSKYPSIGKSSKKTKKSDLEVSLEKQGALKEQVDTHINIAIRHLDVLSKLAIISGRSLQNLKSQYADKFDPELEHQLLELLSNANIVDALNKVQSINSGVKALLARANETDEASQVAAE